MLFYENTYLKEFIAKIISIKDNNIVLDKTAFYAKSGGQPGDEGIFINNAKSTIIKETIRDNENNISHIAEENINLKIGDEIKGIINWEKRYQYMKMHSALHLLCSIVPFGVTGGQIGYEKSRLDFDAQNNIIDKLEIENKINNLIKEDYPITYKRISLDELDKNPELVRTMSVKPPRISGKIRLVQIGNIDLQPCGGTHVKSTKEIGKISILKIENKGKKNRRIIVNIV